MVADRRSVLARLDPRNWPRLAAASGNGLPRPPVGQAAGIDRETEYFLKGYLGTITNPDVFMATVSPTNTAYYQRGFGLYEEMRDKDCVVLGVTEQRKNAVLAAPPSLLPVGKDEPALRIAGFCEAALKQIAGLEDSRAELWMATYYGMSVLELDWQRRDLDWQVGDREESLSGCFIPARLWSRRRGRFTFDEDYQLRLLTPAARIAGEPVPDRKFIHYAPRRRYENPWGVPLARPLWFLHHMKKHAGKWRMVSIEKFGAPFGVIYYPKTASTEEQEQYDAVLRSLQQGSGIRLVDEAKFEMANIGHSITGASPHESWSDYCDKQITIAVLGETLTTDIGDVGSKAAAQTHFDVRASIVQSDAEALCKPMQQLLDWMVEVNFGPALVKLAPRYTIDTRQKDVAGYLANVAAAQKVGVAVSESQTREETSFRAPEDEEDELRPARNPSPLELLSAPGRDREEGDEGANDNDEQAAALDLRFIEPTQAALAALSLAGAPLRYKRPGGFTAAENRRARAAHASLGRLADNLSDSELGRLFTDGVAAASAILGEIPQLVKAWIASEYDKRGIGPDDPISAERAGSDPTTLPWAELSLPAEMRAAFVDRLNDDLTIAQLLSREALLLQADAQGIEARLHRPSPTTAAGDDPIDNPLVEALWGEKRIIPHRVLSVHTRRVFQSVEYDTFYKLDALSRASAFTAWDLAEADVRHLGGALQDAINWGYTRQQFEDYVFDRLQARYVQQGTELHAWHVETIYDVNLSVAYNQAHADELNDLQEFFPYTKFVNPDPQAPPCVERAGRVWPTNSAFLRHSTPPLHFGCGSSLRAMTEAMLKAEGLTPETAMPSVSPERYPGPVDPATGQPVGEPAPFGAWAPLSERYEHLEAA